MYNYTGIYNCMHTYMYMHTTSLLYTGEVYTFGKYGEGQLGRSAPSEASGGKGERRQDNEAWHLSPSPIPSLGDGCKVVWVGAGGNQTFIAVDESLVSDQNLSKCHVFADSQTIGECFSCKRLCMPYVTYMICTSFHG